MTPRTDQHGERMPKTTHGPHCDREPMVSNTGLSFRDTMRAIRSAMRCPECGKSTIVLNTAGYRRPYAPQAVSEATHCTCPGGTVELERKARAVGAP
jgi:hypothetical protein